METKEIPTYILEKANEWLSGSYDEQTKKEVKKLLDQEDSSSLIDAFYRDLEFGTGGLRGIMGVGSNRMNIYTVGGATQGLCNYLKKVFSNLPIIKVAIGYDCRNNSRLFAETAAGIFSANGIKVYLFENLRPTPELSFTIRKLSLQSGVILTASHNPKAYNGYKVYWNDGSQIVEPHDIQIIKEVEKVKVDDIRFNGPKENITIIGKEIDEAYLEKIKSISLSPEVIRKHNNIKIVFTPIHGTGVKLVPMALAGIGFTNIIHVPEQDVVDGNFPTVISPNPEEPAAMALALKKAAEVNADLMMATDPDADRLGVSVKNDKGEFILLNGNQTFLIFLYYIITRRKELGLLKGKEFVVKTIVTTELAAHIAMKNSVEYYDCYTGFKYIAEVIRENEGKKEYIGGGEESFGFLPADFVRDKDAVSSCALMAEIAAWAKDQGKTLFELLQDVYLQYGFSKEKMKYIVRTGKSGAEEIEKMMVNFRANPPVQLAGSKLVTIKDYENLTEKNLQTGDEKKINQKFTSNVLQFFTEDGSKVSVRPSGTEPKIKFYIEVKAKLESRDQYYQIDEKCGQKIEKVMSDLGLLDSEE
jgi:phosphoglucomutase